MVRRNSNPQNPKPYLERNLSLQEFNLKIYFSELKSLI